MDITNVKLHLWQKYTLKMLAGESNNREIIWIHGSRGNESKSWMQCYIKSYYGYAQAT